MEPQQVLQPEVLAEAARGTPAKRGAPALGRSAPLQKLRAGVPTANQRAGRGNETLQKLRTGLPTANQV